MKNLDLVSLVNKGVNTLDYSDVNPEFQYSVYKFLSVLKKKNAEYEEERKDLVEKTLGDNLQKCVDYESNVEGHISEEEYTNYMHNLLPVISELFNQEVEFPSFKKLNSTEYFKLKTKNPNLTFEADQILEGVLWEDNI